MVELGVPSSILFWPGMRTNPAECYESPSNWLSRRGEHDKQIERAQHGVLDVTAWVVWFTEQAPAAFDMAVEQCVDGLRWRGLTSLVRCWVGPGGFDGGMSTRKYESLTGTARATASRDLIELAALGFLRSGRRWPWDAVLLADRRLGAGLIAAPRLAPGLTIDWKLSVVEHSASALEEVFDDLH